MRIAITGGQGLIGINLVKTLLNTNFFTIKILYQGKIYNKIEHISYIKVNFTDKTSLIEALKDIDIVIHLAWTTTPSSASTNPFFDIQTNLLLGVNLLDACVYSKVKKVIFASSGGTVYGIPNTIPIPENHELNPISCYGISKLAFEKYLQFYSRQFNLDYLILRISNAYGLHQSIHKGQGVIGIWVDKIIKNEKIEIWGDGSAVRDYVYVDDISLAILKSIEKEIKNEVFNVGNGKGVALKEIIDLLKKSIKKEITIHYLESRNIDVPSNVLCIKKIEEKLDWKPLITIEEGLQKILNSLY
jgi:UDP-glucose 4-epimerase